MLDSTLFGVGLLILCNFNSTLVSREYGFYRAIIGCIKVFRHDDDELALGRS